jgi:predicted dinucleotide-binding enzyme
MTTIGFIGSGKIGSQLARQAVKAGYDVVLSNSRGPETLEPLVAELGSKARAATGAEAAAAGDVVVVTLPFHAIDTLPVAELAGKVVLDTNNYYFEREGHIAELDSGETTSSAILQAQLPASHVVKAFNHIFSAAITTDASAAGTPGRRALAVFGDDPVSNVQVIAIHDDLGFDAVDGGPLAESWKVQRDTPPYGPHLTADEFRSYLDGATR